MSVGCWCYGEHRAAWTRHVLVCAATQSTLSVYASIMIVLVRQSCCRCRWPTNKSKIHCNFSSELDILLCKLESTSFRAVVRDFYFYSFVFVLFSLYSSRAHVPRFFYNIFFLVCLKCCVVLLQYISQLGSLR